MGMLHYNHIRMEGDASMLHSYRNPGQLASCLRNAACGDRDGVLLVPSHRDKPLLSSMLSLSGEELPGTFSRKGTPWKIWVWDDLYRDLVQACPRTMKPRAQIDPPDHWLLIRRCLSRIRDRHPGGLPSGARGLSFSPIAGEAIRELLLEDISPENLAESLECQGCPPGGGCSRPGDEGGVLCRLYRDYRDCLGRENLADSAQLPSLGMELLKDHPGEGSAWARSKRICAAGFLSFSSGQVQLLKSLRDRGALLEFWIPACGEGDFYTAVQQFGEEGTPLDPAADQGGVPCLFMRGGDLRLSTDTLARELLLWSAGEGYLSGAAPLPFPGWDSVALCGDPDEIRCASGSFARYRIPFSVREGVLVSETPFWKAVIRAWDLFSDGWPSRETADLLSGILFSPFSFPREEFSRSLPSGMGEWQSFLEGFPPEDGQEGFGRCLRLTGSIAAGGAPEELLRALAAFGPGKEGMAALQLRTALLPELDGELRKVNLAVREAREKAKSLGDLRRDMGEAGRDPLGSEEALAFLSHWAETATTWMPMPLSPAVSLYPGTPPVFTSSPVWILLGASGKRWPGTVRESPLLSDRRKEALHENAALGLARGHLPLVREKRSQREALFRRLTACGESLCILVTPLGDENGRPLALSPFIDTAEKAGWISPAAPPLERSTGDILLPSGQPRIRHVEISWDQRPRNGRPGKRLGAEKLPVPPSSPFFLSWLDDYASCPFLCYFRHLAGMEPHREELFRPDLAGLAVHRLWEKAWQRRMETGESLPELAALLFEQSMQEKWPHLLSDGRLQRARKGVFQKVLRLASFQQGLDEAGLAGARQGQRREAELPVLPVGGTPFRGRCDRMDILADGRAVLFDYKSGASGKYRKKLQLAAYGMALSGEGIIPAAGVYLCMGDGAMAAATSDTPPPGIPAGRIPFRELEDAARETLEKAAWSMSSGMFPPFYESEACPGCDYASLCRRMDFKPEGEYGDDDAER